MYAANSCKSHSATACFRLHRTVANRVCNMQTAVAAATRASDSTCTDCLTCRQPLYAGRLLSLAVMPYLTIEYCPDDMQSQAQQHAHSCADLSAQAGKLLHIPCAVVVLTQLEKKMKEICQPQMTWLYAVLCRPRPGTIRTASGSNYCQYVQVC